MTIKVTYNVTDVYVSETLSATYINISYEAPMGASAVWGSITGTLSNQTDLQTALDLKVPYTGATTNVDLGEFELKAGQVEFDQTPTGTAGVGVMRWNDTDGTVDLGLKGGSVTLQVGQEQILRVVNKTGADLLESQYRAVRIRLASEGGTQGQRLAVVLAQGNNDANSADTIGIVTETITNNQEGFICTSGLVRDINTTGSLQSETWADGDIIYLSPTIAGAITNIKPTAPNHSVILGYVVYAHITNGKIFVKCDNGYELGELHDVNTTGATNGQVLKYNGTIWTPSADAGITGTGTAGQVAYFTGATTQAGSNNLFYSSNILTITHPTGGLPFIVNNGATTGTIESLRVRDNTASQQTYSLVIGTGQIIHRATWLGGTGVNMNHVWANATSAGAVNNNMTLYSTGNLGINTSSDSGQRLQVTGTALITGATTFTATGASISMTTAGDTSIWSQVTNAGGILYVGRDNAAGSSFGVANAHVIYGTAARPMVFFTNSTSRMTLDASGNLGLGVTPSAWGSTFRGLQVGLGTSLYNNAVGNGTFLSSNSFFNGTNNIYINTTTASAYGQSSGQHQWFTAASGTAGNAITFTQAMTLDASGNLQIGQTTDIYNEASRVVVGINGATNSLISMRGGGTSFGYIYASSASFDINANSRPLTFSTTGTEKGRFFNNGNFSIGSTTDSGEKLQVNGTAKITGASTFGGFITVTRNQDANVTTFNATAGVTPVSVFVINTDQPNSRSVLMARNGYSLVLGTQDVNRVTIDTTGAATFSSSVQVGGGTINASAILQADSTTKGFLPPRMTTVQKLAIATPAAGLMVYDTTLNQMSYYNATTWINF